LAFLAATRFRRARASSSSSVSPLSSFARAVSLELDESVLSAGASCRRVAAGLALTGGLSVPEVKSSPTAGEAALAGLGLALVAGFFLGAIAGFAAGLGAGFFLTVCAAGLPPRNESVRGSAAALLAAVTKATANMAATHHASTCLRMTMFD